MLPQDDMDDDDEMDPENLIQDTDDAEEMLEDDAGIDLFGDNFDRDYQRQEDNINDNYEAADIDDDEYAGRDLAARRQLGSQDFLLPELSITRALYAQLGEDHVSQLSEDHAARVARNGTCWTPA